MACKLGAVFFICLVTSGATVSAVTDKVSLVQSHWLVGKANNIQEPLDTTTNLYGTILQACGQSRCGIDPPAIHAICIKELPSGFSSDTGQSAWSSDPSQKDHPHCVCLGAWSMYVKEGKDVPNLQCGAIPAGILSDDYVQNWATWNGNELDGQEVEGLKDLFAKCSSATDADADSKKVFSDKFCAFVQASTKQNIRSELGGLCTSR